MRSSLIWAKNSLFQPLSSNQMKFLTFYSKTGGLSKVNQTNDSFRYQKTSLFILFICNHCLMFRDLLSRWPLLNGIASIISIDIEHRNVWQLDLNLPNINGNTQYSDGSIRAQNGMAAASKQNNEMYRIKESACRTAVLLIWVSCVQIKRIRGCGCVYFIWMCVWMLFPFQAVVDWCAQHFVNHSFIHPSIHSFYFFLPLLSIICSSVHSFTFVLNPNVLMLLPLRLLTDLRLKIRQSITEYIAWTCFLHIPHSAFLTVCACVWNYYHKGFSLVGLTLQERVAEKSKLYVMPSLVR